jgi:hypothetical protein
MMGLDYTQMDIARRLARDGEGEPIAWDFVDNDPRPYLPSPNETPPAYGGDGTLLVRTLIERSKGRIRVVPVRVDPGRPASLAQALAFVARTPARIVLVPIWSERREDWEPFKLAAEHFRSLLLIGTAGDGDRDLDRLPAFPAALTFDNMLVLTVVDQNGRFLANWGAATVDAAIEAGDRGAATVSPASDAAISAAVLAADTLPTRAISGAELKQIVLRGAEARTAEHPPRTRTRAVLAFPSGVKPTGN